MLTGGGGGGFIRINWGCMNTTIGYRNQNPHPPTPTESVVPTTPVAEPEAPIPANLDDEPTPPESAQDLRERHSRFLVYNIKDVQREQQEQSVVRNA